MSTAPVPYHGAPAVRVTDLRGRSAPVAEPVLVDVTGERARHLRTLGRLVSVVFLLWLCGLVLAGLGLFPGSVIPLGRSLHVAERPPKLSVVSTPRPPAASDLRPARPLAIGSPDQRAAAPAGKAPTSKSSDPDSHPVSPVAVPPGQVGAVTTKPGKLTVPGQTGVTPASTNSNRPATGTSPSANAPGQTKRTTTVPTTVPTTTSSSPGASGAAPGKDRLSTPGHAQTTP
jgi:hypothetical protein